MIGISFLTVRPDNTLFNFCEDLIMDGYEIYVTIDDNEYCEPEHNPKIQIIKLNNKNCEDEGFKSTVSWLNEKACSRDKALYYFCKINKKCSHVWFIEEDVFVPTSLTIKLIDEKYLTGDLLSAKHMIKNDKIENWHWGLIFRQTSLQLPYARSMICAIRVSDKLLRCIEKYADENKNLFMNEALFNTIALHNSLEIIQPTELAGIVWRYDWQINEINKFCLYHPIKNISTQWIFRKALE